jgi:hypothetical protein
MKKSAKLDPLAERPDLDFSKGVRGKYTNLLAKGTNIAIIDPTLHPYFPDSESVNRALRAFLAIGESMHVVSFAPRRRSVSAGSPLPERKAKRSAQAVRRPSQALKARHTPA